MKEYEDKHLPDGLAGSLDSSLPQGSTPEPDTGQPLNSAEPADPRQQAQQPVNIKQPGISPMAAAAGSGPEFTDPKSFPEAPYVCKVADNESVSLGSGSLQYTVTDFVLPGKNGFDLNITRQYDSSTSNTTDPDAFIDLGPPSFVTVSRANDHNLRQYGLGVGWSFKLPSIEVVPDSKRDNSHVKYSTNLHLADGKNYVIEDNTLKDYKMTDVWLDTNAGSITHPVRTNLSRSYTMAVCYQNGNKDYFTQINNDLTGKIECWRLAAQRDKFGNTIFFSFPAVGGMAIVDTWGRDIVLEKVNRGQVWHLPDGSTIKYQTEDTNGRKLAAVVDQMCRTTLYQYTQLISDSRIFASPDPGINIRHMLLHKIIQPSGAVTQYEYGINGQTPMQLTQGDGFTQSFPVRSRKDVADGMEYNVITYSYTKDTKNEYIENARSQNLLGIEEKQIFNKDGQLITKEIRDNNVLTSSSEYEYGTDKNGADYKLQKSEKTKEFNKSNSNIFVRKNTATTYTADKKTNVERTVETYPEDPSLNQETYMTYGAYGTMTKKTVNKSDDVKIHEVYTLRSSPDNKVVEYKRVYENDELREKTRYIYGSGNDDQNLVIRELRYFAADNEDLNSSTTFVETQKTYDRTQYTSEPVETRVIGMKDVDGQDIDPIVQLIEYDSMGRTIKTTDADGFETDTEYDALGRVICERFPAIGGKRDEKRNVYDDTANTVTTIDENGNRKRMQYTRMGQIKAEYVAVYDKPYRDDVLLKSFTYDALGRTLTETSYDGEGSSAQNIRAVTACLYDTKDRIISTRVDMAGYLKTETYIDVWSDPERPGRMWTKHTANVHGGNITPDMVTSEYMDQAGRKRFEFADGHRVMSTEYDKAGNAVLTVDALNNVTRMVYDHAARETMKVQRVAGLAYATQTFYDALGNNIRTIDPSGCVTEYIYDAMARKLQKTSAFDERRAIEKYFYDGRGNVTEQRTGTDDGWCETTNEYDARAQLTAATMWLDNSKTSFSRTEYVYDSCGNKIEVITGLSENIGDAAVVSYAYDRFGNVTDETDALGQITHSEYDKTGRQVSNVDRNGATMTYEYDALGNITEQRVTAKAGFGEILSVRETIYSPSGQKRSETAREYMKGKETALTIGYVYDGRGQTIEQRDPENVVKYYTYDLGGNKTGFKLYRGSSVEPDIDLWYNYDELNRVTEVRRGGSIGEIIAEYVYDMRGNPTLQKYPQANLETQYGYNLAGLTTWLKNFKNGNVVSEFYYTYDVDGNQLSKKNNELENSYEYDKLGRLTAEREVDGNTYLYEYDAFSNRSGLVVSGYDNYETAYEYDLNNRLLTETRVEHDFTEICKYSYDASGNQIRSSREVVKGKKPWSGPERHLFVAAPRRNGKAVLDIRDYNGFGQLVQIYRDGQRISLSYRPDNMRHSKEVTYPFKPALNRKTTHFWDGQNIVLETNTTGEVKAIYLRGTKLITQQIGEDLFYYLHNAHGDVVQRISENGTSAPQYRYDAFGNEKDPKDTDPNPFRYCGEYFDLETEEMYFRARSYDPSTGRFTTEDTHWNSGNMIYGDSPQLANQQPKQYEYDFSPAGYGISTSNAKMPDINAIVQSVNLYAYCNSNPVTNIDSTGQFLLTCLIIGAVAGAVIGGVLGGADAYTKAANSGATGWELAGKTALGILGGAVVGGIIGGIAGAFVGMAASVLAGAASGAGGSAALSLASGGSAGGVASLTGGVAIGTSVNIGLGAGALGLLAIRTSTSNGYFGEKHLNDHDPEHIHFNGPKTHVKIGVDGKPLPGQPKLGPQASKALKRLWKEIVKLFSK